MREPHTPFSLSGIGKWFLFSLLTSFSLVAIGLICFFLYQLFTGTSPSAISHSSVTPIPSPRLLTPTNVKQASPSSILSPSVKPKVATTSPVFLPPKATSSAR